MLRVSYIVVSYNEIVEEKKKGAMSLSLFLGSFSYKSATVLGVGICLHPVEANMFTETVSITLGWIITAANREPEEGMRLE